MHKRIITSLVLPTLLVGCGSSGSSNSNKTVSSAKYTWQVVELRSVAESVALADNCVIYADSVFNEGEVITAYEADQDFNILYHNADGSIFDTIGADETINGAYTIDSDDVPNDGYVTLEQIESITGGNQGSYMFSVQKSLLSNMVLNVTTTQTGDCYSDSDYRETASGTAVVNVSQPSTAPAFYQSSYDEDSINGQTTTTAIPVDSPYPAGRDTLITAFNTYDATGEEKTDLTHWAFVDAANLYEDGDVDGGALLTSPLSSAVTNITWSSTPTVTLDSDSSIIALHEGTSYYWQPIYDSTDALALAYDSTEVSLWSSYFSGTEGDTGESWLFNSFMALSDETDISLTAFATVSAVTSIDVSSTCTVASSFCIDTDDSFSSADMSYQRVHIRLTEDSGSASNINYQSIYTESNEEPVVLENSQFDFNDPTLTRVELNLMSSDTENTDTLEYLMLQNIDLVALGDDTVASNDLYSDINGLVTTDTESDALYQSILATNTTTLMNANEP